MNQQVAMSGKRLRRSLEEWAFDVLGTEWCGNVHAPGDHYRVQLDPDYLGLVTEDGGTLWIGTSTEWSWHCRPAVARRLAWFILWRWWVVGEWCGIRTALWFWLLRRRCARYKVRRAREQE